MGLWNTSLGPSGRADAAAIPPPTPPGVQCGRAVERNLITRCEAQVLAARCPGEVSLVQEGRAQVFAGDAHSTLAAGCWPMQVLDAPG